MIADEYRQWLIESVSKHLKEYGNYRKLLTQLDSIDFYSTITNDKNRIADALDIRYRFAEQTNYNYRDVCLYLTSSASVLEVIYGIAIRIDEYILWDPEEPSAVGKWIFDMLTNLHLEGMTDDNFNQEYVLERIDILLNRMYKRNGDGGLFKTRGHYDMRKREIWYQLMIFLNENVDL